MSEEFDLNRSRHRSEWVLERMRVILAALAVAPRRGDEVRALVGGENPASALKNLRNDGLVELSEGLWRLTDRGASVVPEETPR